MNSNESTEAPTLRSRSIAQKLYVLLALSLAGLVILASFSIYTLRTAAGRIRTAESKARVHGTIYNDIITGKDVEADVLPPPEYIIESFLTAHLLVAATSADEIKQHTAALAELEKQYRERHAYWQTNLVASPLKEALVNHASEPAETFYQIVHREFLPAINAGNRTLAAEILQQKLATEYAHQRTAVDQVVKLTRKNYEDHEAELVELLQSSEFESAAVLRHSAQILGAVLLSTILIVGAAIWFISRQVTASVRHVAGELDLVAQAVAEAAAQSSDNSQSLAQGASQQSASLEESSAALVQLSSMSSANAQRVDQATELARKTCLAAETGARHMSELNHAIQEINASSDDVSKIIKTIDEIAFQTNILSLNAAVEAARAGEAGMGFAVVADEVRNLARRSADAARETANRIESSLKRSARSVELSQRVNEAFREIVANAKGVDELDASIASATAEENNGLKELTNSVGQIEKVTQITAASAEENAAAAQELKTHAATLHNSIGQLLAMAGNASKQDLHEAVLPPPSQFSTGNSHPPTPLVRARSLPIAEPVPAGRSF